MLIKRLVDEKPERNGQRASLKSFSALNAAAFKTAVTSLAVFLILTRPASAALRFIVMGDSRPILATLPQSPPFKQILWEMDTIAPDFAVHVGDLVFGYFSSLDELRRQYDDLAQTLSRARTPVYFAIGNHEVGSSGGEGIFREKVGELYFSFNEDKSHFIILDTDWGGYGDTGTLGEKQMNWLAEDLAANRGAENIFVFMHKPMFTERKGKSTTWARLDERDRAHNLFTESGNVRAVFAGHIHAYRRVQRDGIEYFVTGGAGAEAGPPDKSEFYHYLLVNARGKSLNVNVIEPYHIWYSCAPECDGTNDTFKVDLINTDYSTLPLKFGGVEIKAPTLTDGRRYASSGASIVDSRDNGDGTTTLRLRVYMHPPVGHSVFRIEPSVKK